MAKTTTVESKKSKKETTQQKQQESRDSGGGKSNGQKQKVISHPNDVANLVMSQLNTVKTRKDDLESAIKGLADLTTQLVRAYAANVQTIQQMYKKIKELEAAQK